MPLNRRTITSVIPTIAIATTLGFSFSSPVHAQTAPTPGSTNTGSTGIGPTGLAEEQPDIGGEDLGGTPTSGAPATTDSVVAAVKAATSYCSALPAGEYTIDCLAERLDKLSRELKGTAGFEDVHAVLKKTSKELSVIARRNRSDTLTPARFTTTGQNPIRTTRRLIPVDDASMSAAVSQALVVLAEAETLLLRSAEGSADRAVQYQRIASAIGSNKVLLRSL